MQLSLKLHLHRRFIIKNTHHTFCTAVEDFYLDKYKDILPKYYKLTYTDIIPGHATIEGCNNY
jgi:hypothetical protein